MSETSSVPHERRTPKRVREERSPPVPNRNSLIETSQEAGCSDRQDDDDADRRPDDSNAQPNSPHSMREFSTLILDAAREP